MKKVQCPQCKKYIEKNSAECPYCKYPFNFLNNKKEEFKHDILSQFNVAFVEHNRDIMLQCIGILDFLKYNKMELLQIKIEINDHNYQKALKIFDKINPTLINEEYILLKLHCLAMMGDKLKFIQFYINIQHITENYWEVIYNLLLCTEHLTDKSADIYKQSDQHFIIQWNSNHVNFECSKAKVLIKIIETFVKQYRNYCSYIFYVLNTDNNFILPKDSNRELTNNREILSYYKVLFSQDNMDLNEVLRNILDDIIQVNDYVYFNKKIKESREYISRILCDIFKNNFLLISNNNMILPFIRCFLWADNTHIQNILKKYDDLISEGINNHNDVAVEIFQICIDDSLINASMPRLFEHYEKYLNLYDNNKLQFSVNNINKYLSPKGYIAFISAEKFMQVYQENISRLADAGSLSLSYFKILEIELNYRIINPIIKWCNIDEMYRMYDEHLSLLQSETKRKSYTYKWGTCIQIFKRIINNKEFQMGMELGSLNILLSNITRPSNDQLAQMVLNITSNNLTEKGLEALKKGEVRDMISQEKIQKYRNPPAHARYLPFETAVECRQYVIECIYKISSWFIDYRN